MLKRNIAILIAAGLLGGQVNLATAGESAFPSNDVQVYTKMPPGQLKYFEQRAASTQGVVRGDSFAPSALGNWTKMRPAQANYLDQRAGSQVATLGDAVKEVKINASTKYVTVEHFSTVKIVNGKGQSFVWTAGTIGEAGVLLKTIAPAGFDTGNTEIYVRHPAAHIPG